MSVDLGFMSSHIPELEKRFSLSYVRDTSCVEYFLDSLAKEEQVSQNLILSHDALHHGIYVSKFYPELYHRSGCKFLSAACFYLMVYHAVHLFHLHDECPVWLETDQEVFDRFYVKLREFEFHVCRKRVGERVCVSGVFHDLPIPARAILPVDDPFSRL